jgi:Na+/H+ antiporter NhaD/arsenite permease-like protein
VLSFRQSHLEMQLMKKLFTLFLGLAASNAALSNEQPAGRLDLTGSAVGMVCILIFVAGYALVILEERLQLRKSKPMLMAAALVWIVIALAYKQHDLPGVVAAGIRENFLEYAELFFFLLVAMTYINSMVERGVFDELRFWLVTKGFSFRSLFWLTGFLAFFISPVADNMTTALILCAVVIAVGQGQSRFVAISCTSIAVAANAGGAFSPFGDITTLMVWQKGMLQFRDFFALFIPALVNFVVPALIMQMAIPPGNPETVQGVISARLKYGGIEIVALFLATLVTAVGFQNFLGIPPAYGMMAGLAYLKFYGYYLRRKSREWLLINENPGDNEHDPYDFDVFAKIAQAEWDTLFFFYGVILTVGGLGFIGYLDLLSGTLYGHLGATGANILVGLLSAVVDNIPVMFAVLSMEPQMSTTQWLLVTLTTGVGGSLLSIGSAAGVALMGQARGQYTFFSHLKWTPAIALGYALSIWVHLLMNG